ncbi:anti-sigma factor [Sphingomonas silueang]|uniref:anti-sigma factor n=1 Tax=Sphingomonas silueang TaxID=3156617 RepID=UPI0032B54B87
MPDVTPEQEDELTAAELALRLVDGAECVAGRARIAGDPAFAAQVGEWDERLAPLYAEIAPVPAPPGVWDAVARRIADPAVAVLRRRVRRWQVATGVAGALAAALALMLALPVRPVPVPPPAQPAPMLAVAQLSDDRGTPMLAVGIERRSGLVSVRLQDMPKQARVPELWLIPAGGAPQSLGRIGADGRLDTRIPPDMRRGSTLDATLAVSMEEAAGIPHAAPAGPVVASGPLVTM